MIASGTPWGELGADNGRVRGVACRAMQRREKRNFTNEPIFDENRCSSKAQGAIEDVADLGPDSGLDKLTTNPMMTAGVCNGQTQTDNQ